MTFYILSILIIIFAISVVVARNPIFSSLWLVACLFAQAALFITMDAGFVAVLQILLYAGAIMVLILFVIMLLNLAPRSFKFRTIIGERLLLGTGAFYLAGVIGFAVFMAFKRVGVSTGDTLVAPTGSVENVGNLLLTKYAVPFELLSVLLLVAIVGSIVMSRRDK